MVRGGSKNPGSNHCRQHGHPEVRWHWAPTSDVQYGRYDWHADGCCDSADEGDHLLHATACVRGAADQGQVRFSRLPARIRERIHSGTLPLFDDGRHPSGNRSRNPPPSPPSPCLCSGFGPKGARIEVEDSPLPRQFDVVIERDEEGYYIASVPQLPGCHTQARSLDEVTQRIREAVELCLEVAGAPEQTLEFVGI